MTNNQKAEGRAQRLNEQTFRLAPLARAVALTMAVGGTGATQAQTAFSPAWFASKGAVQNSAAQTGRLPNGKPAGLPLAQQQSDAARQKLQHSIANLGLTAQAIAAEQARQAAARAAAQAAAGGVPDGLAQGGLVVDTNSLTAGWLGAKGPTQTVDGGKTTVTIQQTDSRAILNWETFNVGRNTTVQFQQQADWSVLNKVNDPLARPSQIQGQITGDGTVLIVNRNGVIFSGTSQVNTRNLVAAAATITDDQFRTGGIYGSATTPTFTDALGKIEVQAGAQITTAKPASSTQGGGYAMLLGSEVRNDGTITTPSGQAVLAAGDSFTIRKGAGTDGNAGSTTVGNEVATTRSVGSTSGTVINDGLITAATGDITLTGHAVTQAGVVVSTTSTAKRGTVHLSTRASDDTGTVTLADGSTTAILLENTDATALDAQRDAALKDLGTSTGNLTSGVFDNLSTVADRKDLSRVEIVSGNTVDFQGGSLTLATGGEIAVSAVKRTLVDKGAELDVSGAVGVKVSMESNNIKINAQGNEQRDSASNRDEGNLNNMDLWVDRRKLVLVPAGTNGYATDRWYTEGGLLEVSGYVATGGHTVGEWMAQGGTVTMTGGDLVTRAGSSINLSGGSLDVAAGTIRQSWVKGSDGRLYEVSSAPGDLLYTGLYQGFADEHARWGSTATQTYYSPLIAPQSRLENGYTVGRDAGKLVVATRSAVLEGTLVGDTYQSEQQTKAPQAGLDGYYQSQTAASRGAQLVLGGYRPVYDSTTGQIRYGMTPTMDSVTLKDDVAAIADGIGLNDAVATDRQGAVVLDSGSLSAAGLGGIRIAASRHINVQGAIEVADGGGITLYAPAVDVAADLTAHGGTIQVGNVLRQPQPLSGNPVQDNALAAPSGVQGGVQVRADVTLDATGRYTDLRAADGDTKRLAYLDGGTVSIRSTDSVTLEAGSLIDVSSGAAVQSDGTIVGGKGGSVQLGSGLAGLGADNQGAVLTLDGAIRGHGVKGGGTLAIESASGILIGGQSQTVDGVLKAGQTSQLDLILLEPQDVQVPTGGVLPVDYSYVVNTAKPGEYVGASGVKVGVNFVVAADWLPPASIARYGFYVNGRFAVRGDTGIEFLDGSGLKLSAIPAGSTVRFDPNPFLVSAFANYIVPANVFPQGMPIEDRTVRLAAGSAAPFDVTLHLGAGTRLTAGIALPADAAVAPVTTVSTDLFQSGFSQYDVRGHLGLVVADGASVDVTMPVLRAERSALTLGTDLATAFTPWLPTLYQQDATAGVLTQREGASVSLAAGVPASAVNVSQLADSYVGTLYVGEGAQVRVDPGQSIALSGRAGLMVDGRLEAKGGSIALTGPQDGTAADASALLADGNFSRRAIVLGANAVLDASASSSVATDARGRRYGLVTEGGSISIGGSLLASDGRTQASDAFVVVKEGAVMDASGSSVDIDLPAGGSQTVASDGGSIQLVSSRGVYLDGTAVARAGGAGASGGQLTVALDAPNYLKATADGRVLAPRELIVSQEATKGTAEDGEWTYGHGRIGADQVRDGGFSVLNLYSNGLVSFDGSVSLSVDRELRVYSAALALAKGSDPASDVRLSAPYVLLSGIVNNTAAGDVYVLPSYQGGASPDSSSASLTAQGQLVDVRGTVTLGLNSTVTAVGSLKETRAGFDQLNLISDGDIRFIGGGKMKSGAQADAELLSTGSILMRADQVYPATGVSARVVAGLSSGSSLDGDGRVVIERQNTSAPMPALPYSVFGALSINAAHIDQDGVLRAPLGLITLGSADTKDLTLGTGSVTSVSAAGLVMPYGGTADGVTYTVDGQPVSLKGVGTGPSITLNGADVAVEQGALLDLSGGGDLRGAGFISGRGGSTDARMNPLTQVGSDGFTLPGLTTNPVYAIVPGYASGYAPSDKGGAVDPRIGQQITIGANDVPGLAAGTYTLLPSQYALLAGAFRVELNGVATGQATDRAIAMRNGSFSVTGTVSTAHTAQSSSLQSQVIITPAEVVRHYSQYNETSYADFITQQAALNGTVRAVLPADAKTLNIGLTLDEGSTFRFDGTTAFGAAKDGYGGMVSVATIGGGAPETGAIEVVAQGHAPTAGFAGPSIQADDLNNLGASRLVIGGTLVSTYGKQSNGSDKSNYIEIQGQTGAVILREGAVLKAPEVFLIAANVDGGITVEAGAGINTVGMGKAAFDATNGYVYAPSRVAVLAASNGVLDVQAPAQSLGSQGGGKISLGVCETACGGTPAQLYSEGSLVAATRGGFEMGQDVGYGTRNLTLAVGTVNAGSAEDLAAAQAAGALTSGLTLNQSVLDRLLKGDTTTGAPALERLILTAGDSINLFGDVSLNTIDATTGKSTLAELVLSTPALYGHGDAGDVATIATGKLTWAGSGGTAPAPITGGRGTGEGQLVIKADVVEFGYGAQAKPNNVDDFGRTILGFSDVQIAASQRITANHKGSLLVYQSLVAGADGPQYQGGNLTLIAPLVTGEGGSVNRITAGGQLQVLAPAVGTMASASEVQTGAELSLQGSTVRVDTAVVLPSGKLTVKADGDVELGDRARLDLAGREVVLVDVSKFSWGGDVTLQSEHGNVTQAAGSVIDLSAKNNNAGQLTVIALDAAAGRADLQGQVLGGATGHYDAGGTLVPYRAGGVNIRAQQLGSDDLTGSFASLNQRLNTGGVYGERIFQLKQGDLVIGDELKAHEVSVSLDNGQLTVNGRIDASGEQVGSIRLAAAHGLTVAGTGSLDAHGTVLRVDSSGQVIESPNRATVVLDAGTGRLTLGDGATVDLRHGTDAKVADTTERGTLDLYAARVGNTGSATDANAATYGDMAIDASGKVNVLGAKAIALYGKQVYNDAPLGTDPAASGRPYQVVDQAYLDAKSAESGSFIDHALANSDLLNNRLAGLNNATYRDALHLRPAVEITSATPDGDIIVRGDVDLSGQRYASLNPNTAKTSVYGSGEVGMLTLRAGGDLSIYGSINDGFAPPPETPDDSGWLLTSGVQAYGGDVVVPVGGITLAEGTTYPKGKTLNYAITARNVTLPVGTVLPASVTLDSALALPAGTVLAADVLATNGTVLLAAGSVVGNQGLMVPTGARLMAGAQLPVAVTLAHLTWPKGVALPVAMVQEGSLNLPVGALIAAGTNVALPGGAASVNLRPADSSGRQGRNWAVAEMLPAGSQSWSLSLVAGADLEAADNHLRNTKGTGQLTLADTHYGTKLTAGGTVIGLNSRGLQDILMAAGGMPPGISDPNQMLGMTEAEIIAIYGAFSWADFGLPMDFWSPSAGNILMGLTLQGANQVFNAAGGLPPGMTSISQLVGKTELELVTLYGAFTWSDFGMPSNFWELAQGNSATLNLPSTVTAKAPAYSVLRTGTGDLTLVAGGNFAMQSAYGVYTAGTQTSLGDVALDARYNQARGAINGGSVLGNAAGSQAADYEQLVSGGNSLYQAWYPDHGGNLTMDVGGNLTGDSWSASAETPWSSSSVGNWLWRQGTGQAAGVNAVPTSWWVNFGTYAYNDAVDSNGNPRYWPAVVGFTGIGTLGGGNASIRVGGDAGMITQRTTGATVPSNSVGKAARGEGVVLAVGSTGRVLDDGSVLQTGGGDLDVRVGGGWNSHLEGRANGPDGAVGQTHELYGALVNLRGAINLSAGQVGTIELLYDGLQDAKDIRAGDPYAASVSRATGGLMLMQGDAGASISSRGDLVLGGTGDAGLTVTPNATPFTIGTGGGGQQGVSWFSLWTERTGLQLASAGGQLAFDTRASESIAVQSVTPTDYGANGGWFLLPGTVSAVAMNGSIFYGKSAAGLMTATPASQWNNGGLLQVPQGERRIELLASDSLLGGGYAISSSGAESTIMATASRPAFAGFDASGNLLVSNLHQDAPVVDATRLPLLAFGANTLAESVATSESTTQPSRFYAVNGDVVGLRTGTVVTYGGGPRVGERDVVAAGPVAIKAGRDIVNTGNLLNEPLPTTSDFSNDGATAATLAGNVIVNTHRNDISVLQAGRDILYANIDVAGPGTLELTAGRNIIQNDRATLTSTGPAIPADTRPGASIVVQAGMGSQDPDYSAFAKHYLDTANQAVTGTPLADQPGKVVKLYRDELVQWLGEQFGFKGNADEAVALYGTMPSAQQRIFARQVFFAELRAGGREYNDASGPRYGSYLRGRNAIAAMFPGKENGPGQDTGNLLMYGGAGIHTNVGGDIQVLTPSGAQTYGVEGAAPPSTAGLITRGVGDIQLYSLDSILLGQSRVMTTFGGDILGWSAKGDINAGRGSKTTLVFTPPRREYDAFGNVTLSPDVPSTGAGIATLDPLPEVKPGDIDLIAPLGTVDAGEAGIRVSGNINIAALHVLNAANIQVKGESAGLPTVAAVNVSALTNASTAASTAANAAQEVMQRERETARQQQPSVFTVRVLGVGDEGGAPATAPVGPTSRVNLPYDPKSPVQILGHGDVLDPVLMAQLTEEERRALRRLR